MLGVRDAGRSVVRDNLDRLQEVDQDGIHILVEVLTEGLNHTSHEKGRIEGRFGEIWGNLGRVPPPDDLPMKPAEKHVVAERAERFQLIDVVVRKGVEALEEVVDVVACREDWVGRSGRSRSCC